MTLENTQNPENPYPYPQKPIPVYAGVGFARYRYGLALCTPGLPVLFPKLNLKIIENNSQPEYLKKRIERNT